MADAQQRFITQQATIPADEMNITLEEQILFISEEANFARACVGNSSSKVWECRTTLYNAILATLEAVRDEQKAKVET